MKILEKIFESHSGYDSKNIINRSNIVVSQEYLNKIENGITSEELNDFICSGLKIFKYKTQITIHGIFPKLNNNTILGYTNLIQNKNKSIGIKYNAIDEEKRQRIAKKLKLINFKYHRNSTSCVYQYTREFDKSNYETVLNDVNDLKNKIDTKLFTGAIYMYTANIFGRFILILDLHISIIPENNINTFCNNIISEEEVSLTLQKIENDKKLRELEYLQKQEDNKILRDIELLKYQDNIELLKNKYKFIEKTNELGTYINYSFNYNNELIYTIFYIYDLPGKKKYRLHKKEFNIFNEAITYIPSISYNDKIFDYSIKNVYKI